MTALSGGAVRAALAWSALTNVLLRAGSFAVGILLARLLAPEEFGVYAVALTVQAVLLNLADLGVSADLIRCEDPERRAPTVAAVGLVSGTTLALAMAATALPLATSMGSPQSAPAIAVLAGTVALAGAGVVPFAMLQRRLAQRAQCGIAAVDLVVSSGLTIGLVAMGWGALSIAVGRLAAQSITLVLQFAASGCRPSYRVDRELLRPVLAFGLPVAGANALSWALLNLDNLVIARAVGPVSLGFYVLAFNISTWPMSFIGQLARSVALPYFADRARHGVHALEDVFGLFWALAAPVGAMLAALAGPLVAMVYGDKWAPAAVAVVPLAIFGAVRVLLDLLPSYLLATGSARSTLAVQCWWFSALLPLLAVAVGRWGIRGAGWVHVVVAVGLVLPAYLVVSRGCGLSPSAVLRVMFVPSLAAAIAAIAAVLAARAVEPVGLQLLAGSAVGGLVYLLLAGPRIVGLARSVAPRNPRPTAPSPVLVEGATQ